MSLQIRAPALMTDRFPRVSGDEPIIRERLTEKGLFSPRERG